MSTADAPDPVARIADLLEQSSLNEPALRRLYARIPRRAAQLHTVHGAAAPVAPDFAARLNDLFAAGHTPGARPHTNGEVAAQLTAWGHPISKPYLSQLRSGLRTDPSRETVAALARYFRVHPTHLSDESQLATTASDLALLTRLQLHGLRALSTRAFDLSEESQNLLAAMADRLRRTEGLPDVGVGGVE
ncbi:Nucleoid-associated protein EspR [Nocardia seriolae]|uniref:DNA-binding protein n=1 Tax=Nocardia seriolae TaxID=37332 RepID=A0ABC9YV02_9NOCA|nr:Nucleoid-associated protein EspR [Nocardia seriolae]BEK95731.1 hypothetical protein NSER024013_36370 [Nocardia seriolae]GAM47282.1 DNA-binding protein [Nocardia seriolae]GAP29190.1 DNA-binding protein [Nocardia seriolae]GEM24811.1 hypothetical protein NS2_30500 [Nocardia seriolae NBRC 15557]